jgi:hypothetical protein
MDEKNHFPPSAINLIPAKAKNGMGVRVAQLDKLVKTWYTMSEPKFKGDIKMQMTYKTLCLGRDEEGEKRLDAYIEAAAKEDVNVSKWVRQILDKAAKFQAKEKA